MKNYQTFTYLMFSGLIEIVSLPDLTYGEWIIYDDKLPKYHVNCFEENWSNQIIKDLIFDKKETIYSIISKINTVNSVNLSLQTKPRISLLINSKKKDIELNTLPETWIKNLNICSF